MRKQPRGVLLRIHQIRDLPFQANRRTICKARCSAHRIATFSVSPKHQPALHLQVPHYYSGMIRCDPCHHGHEKDNREICPSRGSI